VSEVVASGVTDAISGSSVRRILADAVLRPWRYRSWIFPRDPDFARKAGVVLDLYERIFCGTELNDDEFVISTDEKTTTQARCRCHPSLPPGRARLHRVEHEYERGGSLNYLAALDVHRGSLIGRCEDKTGIAAFERLLSDVMALEPYASARTVYDVCDNGSSHRGQASIDRTRQKWRNVTVVHLPVHASWLNQIEIVFSIFQRKVLTPNDVTDLDEVAGRIACFERRFNAKGHPFDWRFTRSDLDALLKKLAAHEEAPAHRPAA
jgi:hypothetical protein